MRTQIDNYLHTLHQVAPFMTPNFYCSGPYLEAVGVSVIEKFGWLKVLDGDVVMFPPIPKSGSFVGGFRGGAFPNNGFNYCSFWSDFGGWEPPEKYVKRFLDWEYLYVPHHFLAMDGGNWETFRKNSRKWPSWAGEGNWRYGSTFLPSNMEKVRLLIEWLELREESVEDAEIIAQFVTHPPAGVRTEYLTRGQSLVGINIWDENYQYINYRFCLTRQEPYVEEFTRLMFYFARNGESPECSKLVNDGGTLGSQGLKRFKDKMNPLEKRPVYSWTWPYSGGSW